MTNADRIHCIILVIAFVFVGCLSSFGDCVSCHNLVKVKAATDASRTLRVKSGTVFSTDDSSFGVILPMGNYVLEAEDSNYWYFRAPGSLEAKTIKADKVVEDRMLAGGLMLSKRLVSGSHNANVYSDGAKPGEKIVIQKLGKNFRHLEGIVWVASF